MTPQSAYPKPHSEADSQERSLPREPVGQPIMHKSAAAQVGHHVAVRQPNSRVGLTTGGLNQPYLSLMDRLITSMSRRTRSPLPDPLAAIMLVTARKVTGEARYTDDIPTPGNLLHAVLVMSTRAHARIRSVNPEPAQQVNGLR